MNKLKSGNNYKYRHYLVQFSCLVPASFYSHVFVIAASLSQFDLRYSDPFTSLCSTISIRPEQLNAQITTMFLWLQKYPYGEPTHMAQRQDPWNRLNKKCTLASSRREIYHNDPQAPNDSLDFVLKSQYNHHEEFLDAKNETLFQPETYTEEHGYV